MTEQDRGVVLQFRPRKGDPAEEAIRQAILSLRILSFTYQRHMRIVEPHVLGVHRGARQLLAYQVRGESRSGGLPEWRRFELREIADLRVLDERFAGPRPGDLRGFDHVLAEVGPPVGS